MSRDSPASGEYPDCGRRIRSAYVLIEYEKRNGTAGVFAECPRCDDVVKPV